MDLPDRAAVVAYLLPRENGSRAQTASKPACTLPHNWPDTFQRPDRFPLILPTRLSRTDMRRSIPKRLVAEA
ncbi:hypothetical protein HBH70_199830 [Parastagonospora nodorum]|nr:hypothetical protein HBH53_192120 [Parastagonospora nodorum]KAH4095149.1 hypothetical protein HBH46_171190 [Parastagonospora nodorum]KAH4183081.1 hypothetical protein HBH42_209470 [Parastagonospora nodorum]KAH4217898.1 hypothetical protein HBI06_209410 [Parastagonospora nodorum]KAH4230105.1 hypothetical protein HBI05_189810 [Parastagonospora nodorum]